MAPSSAAADAAPCERSMRTGPPLLFPRAVGVGTADAGLSSTWSSSVRDLCSLTLRRWACGSTAGSTAVEAVVISSGAGERWGPWPRAVVLSSAWLGEGAAGSGDPRPARRDRPSEWRLGRRELGVAMCWVEAAVEPPGKGATGAVCAAAWPGPAMAMGSGVVGPCGVRWALGSGGLDSSTRPLLTVSCSMAERCASGSTVSACLGRVDPCALRLFGATRLGIGAAGSDPSGAMVSSLASPAGSGDAAASAATERCGRRYDRVAASVRLEIPSRPDPGGLPSVDSTRGASWPPRATCCRTGGNDR
jgi:hypothetical protein